MANKRKLQNEIDRNLKQTDEGIGILFQIQEKLDHATSLQMKEKHEQDMKKEIKKLQRLREFFRQQLGKNEIKDTSKLELACTRIVNEMEKYREREKEFKQHKMSKAAIQKQNEREGKFNFGSDEESYSDDDNNSNPDEDGLGSEEDESTQVPDEVSLQRDKEWFITVFVGDLVRGGIIHYEQELEAIRNKKKGGSKKNKEKVNTIMRQLNHVKQIRDNAEELQIWLDYMEVGRMSDLKKEAKAFAAKPEDEPQRALILKSIEVLLEHVETNRTQEANRKEAELKRAQGGTDKPNESAERRILSELLKNKKNADVIQEKFVRVDQLKIGNILDAQDYLDKWHLAIVVEEKESTSKMLHFVTFNKGNRDEEFGEEDSNRIAPAFSRTEPSIDPDSQFQVLRTYYTNYKQQRHGKKQQLQEEVKSAHLTSSNQGDSSPAFKDSFNSKQSQQHTVSSFSHLSNSVHGNLQQQRPVQQQEQQQRNKFSSKSKSPTIMSDEDPMRFSQQLKKGGALAQPHQEQLQEYKGQQPPFMPPGNLPPFMAMPEGKSEDQKSMATNLFSGPNPFASFKELTQPVNPLATSNLSNPFGTGDLVMPMSEQKEPANVMPDLEPPVFTKFKSVQGLLSASFKNMPVPQDQEVVDPKHPVSVLHHDSEVHDYPTVPLYNRKDNFSRFDLETLFFAFYYQQGTHQQHMAAVELKKKNWKFNKKFVTWFKKADGPLESGQPGSPSAAFPGRPQSTPATGPQGEQPTGKDLGKYVFFDFENGWHQRVSEDIEMDLSQIENELNVQPTPHGGAPISAPARNNQ